LLQIFVFLDDLYGWEEGESGRRILGKGEKETFWFLEIKLSSVILSFTSSSSPSAERS
jgi:hypothetical protein